MSKVQNCQMKNLAVQQLQSVDIYPGQRKNKKMPTATKKRTTLTKGFLVGKLQMPIYVLEAQNSQKNPLIYVGKPEAIGMHKEVRLTTRKPANFPANTPRTQTPASSPSTNESSYTSSCNSKCSCLLEPCHSKCSCRLELSAKSSLFDRDSSRIFSNASSQTSISLSHRNRKGYNGSNKRKECEEVQKGETKRQKCIPLSQAPGESNILDNKSKMGYERNLKKSGSKPKRTQSTPAIHQTFGCEHSKSYKQALGLKHPESYKKASTSFGETQSESFNQPSTSSGITHSQNFPNHYANLQVLLKRSGSEHSDSVESESKTKVTKKRRPYNLRKPKVDNQSKTKKSRGRFKASEKSSESNSIPLTRKQPARSCKQVRKNSPPESIESEEDPVTTSAKQEFYKNWAGFTPPGNKKITPPGNKEIFKQDVYMSFDKKPGPKKAAKSHSPKPEGTLESVPERKYAPTVKPHSPKFKDPMEVIVPEGISATTEEYVMPFETPSQEFIKPVSPKPKIPKLENVQKENSVTIEEFDTTSEGIQIQKTSSGNPEIPLENDSDGNSATIEELDRYLENLSQQTVKTPEISLKDVPEDSSTEFRGYLLNSPIEMNLHASNLAEFEKKSVYRPTYALFLPPQEEPLDLSLPKIGSVTGAKGDNFRPLNRMNIT